MHLLLVAIIRGVFAIALWRGCVKQLLYITVRLGLTETVHTDE